MVVQFDSAVALMTFWASVKEVLGLCTQQIAIGEGEVMHQMKRSRVNGKRMFC